MQLSFYIQLLQLHVLSSEETQFFYVNPQRFHKCSIHVQLDIPWGMASKAPGSRSRVPRKMEWVASRTGQQGQGQKEVRGAQDRVGLSPQLKPQVNLTIYPLVTQHSN